MSNHIDKSWVVFASIENFEHDRCVDLFFRTDKTYGFEEFRRDPEDRGEWTPVQFYSGLVYRSSEALPRGQCCGWRKYSLRIHTFESRIQ
jgi:hypothetical protein